MRDANAAPPSILDGRRYSPVWLVPLAAVLFGAWIIFSQFADRGTEITIHFETAEGIEAGKTKILTRNVQVGTVTDIQLSDDRGGVLVVAQIDEGADDLLTSDTKFWVVKPRLDAGGISGLGTVLSGAYIELQPGEATESAEDFSGLEVAPVRTGNKPGVRVTLTSVDQPLMHVGQSIRYQGMTVGTVETMRFDPVTRTATYSAYIEEPYDALIAQETRFWRIDAVNFNTSVDGIALKIASLESLLSGGITFGLPESASISAPSAPRESYTIHPNAKAAMEPTFKHAAEFVVLMDTSVRGLKVGAPVLLRGTKIGQVTAAGENYQDGLSLARPQSAAVRIAIEPGRLGLSDNEQGLRAVRSQVDQGLRAGLVARMESGNLITGRNLIALNYSGASQPLRQHQGLRVIPLTRGDIAQIPVRANAVLEKLEKLPLERTLNQASASLDQIGVLAARLDALVENDETQAIPAQINETLAQAEAALAGLSPGSPAYRELNKTLNELRQTLERAQPILRQLDDKPEALIFGAEDTPDLEPRKRTE